MELDSEALRQLLSTINSNKTAFIQEALKNNDRGMIIRRLANTISDIASEISSKAYSSNRIDGISDVVIDNIDMVFLNSEKMRLISLVGNSVVGILTITNDNPTNVKTDYRQMFTSMLIADATKAILIHNHPEGISKPSEQDIKFTEVFKELCSVFDITLRDHFVISKSGVYGILSGEEELFDEEDLPILRDIARRRLKE